MPLELLAVPALAYAAVVGFLAVRQRSFIFHPPAERPDRAAMAAAGFAPADGEGARDATPRFWIAPARAPETRVVVFLHGNASTVADGAAKLAPLLGAGLGAMLVEYPGYGGAPGRPTEATILAQAEEALRVLARAGVGPERIVLWGESLGTGVATRLAIGRGVAGVVLEAPFTSVADRAQEIYWWTPARFIVLDAFDNLSRIARIGAPLLLLHGERDETTPAAHGRRLLAAAAEPKRGVFFPEGGHVDLADHGMMREALSFIASLPGERRA
jgi:fermentation-respiration switch protein FrsA (DUF1100 family)